ncbi:hypothetical protein A1O3_10190 [Capronia epimyces CBS 606.96]|uniref:Major facilitator superfamily (MFS) profile domain-containing protein n=1 Tax=Capronia epimyces CBS 606.96 TaxID=1182542 RepID=W9X9Y8_9EURO|nr:uncharacterized protein A1O3_10190 [Capronia epimyces CBS 606.96]EXJ77033.1 hypothetical protein A1O3_10190 [Capronia epimyces CBS 606.96]
MGSSDDLPTPVEGPPTHEKDDTGRWRSYTKKKRPWRLVVTDFEAIVNADYAGSGTSEDPYIVDWLDDDPENPKTYTERMKWGVTLLAATLTLCVAFASSAYSGAVDSIIEHFHCSEEVVILGMSLMVLGYAVGPLLWAPLSETFGRRYVFLISLVFCTLWLSLCAASPNIQSLIIFRFLSGTFGSSALVIPGGEIADMFETETRGIAVGIFCVAPFMGPAIGPLIGGFLGTAAGWRWVMGFLGIFAGCLTAIGVVLLPETYAPALLRSRAKLLSQVTGRVYLTAMDARNPLNIRELIKHSLIRPWVLLFLEPIVLSLTLYMSVVYGTLYLCFAAFPIVFQAGRGWNPGVGGLGFMGVLVGFLTGVFVVIFDNKRYIRWHRKTNGFAPPECRLPPAIWGGLAIVVGLAWFAATNGPNIHWASPIIAGFPFGLGFVLVFLCCANYLVDAYVIYAASVLAANSVMRSLFGAIFPLFTTYMYRDIGIHWGSAVPGFIALLCLPFPVLFYVYGARIRRKCKYAAEAAEHLDNARGRLERSTSRATSRAEIERARRVASRDSDMRAGVEEEDEAAREDGVKW